MLATDSSPRLRRPLAASLLALIAGLALVLGLPSAAFAHDRLVSSDPADGAQLDTAPQAITLTFSDTPLDVSPQVRVTGADGTVIADGAPEIDGTTATLPLPNGVPAGRTTVQWRVVSADGHPIEGQFGFDVAQGSSSSSSAAPSSSQTPSASSARSSAPAAPSTSATSTQKAATGLNPLIVAGIVSALVLAVAIALIVLGRRRRR